MIGAKQPESDDTDNYSYVAEHRASGGEIRPKVLRPEVLKLYENYQDRLDASGGPACHPFSAEDRLILTQNANFLNLTHFTALRKDTLTAAPLHKCTFCFIPKATEIDHYLPKALFGEYAIYGPNLLPICEQCNKKKSQRYRREGGGRRYLHPYFDNLPGRSTKFVTAILSFSEFVAVEYDIVRPNGLSNDLWEILVQHFDDLNLRGRYGAEAAENLTTDLSAYYAHFEYGGPEELRRQLLISKRAKEATYGVNHWWTVMLQTLFESEHFCHGGFQSLGPDPDLLPV